MEQMNILERIHGSYFRLTAAERKVADRVLQQPERIQFLSITQLAEECGVAEATVSRFCRSLGLRGFNAFKIELAKHSAVRPQREQDPQTPRGRWAAQAQLTTDAVHQTLELLDPAVVDRAVEYIESAGRCLCMGSGGSMVMASECAHLFSTVTGKFQTVADVHSQLCAVATMDPGDIVILFSYSGATTSGIQVMELAKSRGVRSILVTRFHKSPAARLADVVLLCGSNEGPFQFGSVAAKAAQLTIMDVLFQEYRRRNPAACADAVERIAAALSELHL